MKDSLPLSGTRVLDCSRVLAGPFATMLLADLGADVWKLEPPAGDETRTWGPPFWGDPADRRSAYFASVNRNKRSLVVDLHSHGGQLLLHQLAEGADLLVHNFRPATAGRLGLGTNRLQRRHPQLVVAVVGGFPGEGDAPERPLLARSPRCWRGRERPTITRRGDSRSKSRWPPRVTSLINVLGNLLATGEEPRRYGNAHPNIVPYQAFAARDGRLAIAVGNDAQFGRLLAALGLEDPDGRYATNPRRLEHRDELLAWLSKVIAQRDRDGLVAALERNDVPAGPVNRVNEALAASRAAHPDGWTARLDGIELAPSPIRVDTARLPARLPPPRLGEHTDEVLAEAGLSAEEIARLRQEEAIA